MLITATELRKKLDRGDTVVLGCLLKPVGSAEHENNCFEFIPGTRIFDVDDFSQEDAKFSHTLLDSGGFEKKFRELGVNSDSSVLVYDNIGIYSAPRVWFNLKLMGCDSVVLLNGGLPSWIAEDYPLVKELKNDASHGDFSAELQSNMVVSKEQVLEAIDKPKSRIIDVRSAGRFYGTAPEPREGLRSGHIPGSVNIPFPDFIDGNFYKTKGELKQLFESVGCADDEELIFSCGSGVTACVGYIAAHICGYADIKVYDGSWAEWGSIDELPIEV